MGGKTIKIDKVEAKVTAWALRFFNDTFDSMNAPANPDEKDPPLRQLIKPDSVHKEFWVTALRHLRDIQFVDRETGEATRGNLHCLQNLKVSIEGFQRITTILFDMGFEQICPRYFSTDCVENFFSGVRKQGVTNTSPTCKQYEGAHKTLLINNMTSPKAIGANCQQDEEDNHRDNHVLASLKKLFMQNSEQVNLSDCNITNSIFFSTHFYISLLKLFLE